MLTLLFLACAPEPAASSNLCGTIVREDGAPAANEVVVSTVLDDATACGGPDTGGGAGWHGEEVARVTPDGDHFEAEVPPGSYGVEVFTESDFSGCGEAEVADATTCSADITVTVTEQISVDKPNLYLYPTQATSVAVRIPAWRRITESDPRYPVDGWRATAWPDGRLDTPVGQRDFLFYEMNFETSRFQHEEGWCVAGPLAQHSIADAMADLGFLPNEIGDFSTAWDGEFPEAEQMTVYPQFEGLGALVIDPAPDVLLRAWFVVAAGCQPVEAPVFPQVVRSGYHASEWGVAFEQPLARPMVVVHGG